MHNEDLLFQLMAAVDGLTYVSETTSTLNPFLWPGGELSDGLNVEALRVYRDIPDGIPIMIMDADTFFSRSVDLTNPDPSFEALRFRNLLTLLKTNLSDLTVYVVGERDKEAYVVGRTEEGDYAGVSVRLRES
jgi:hypothetical protein